MKGAIALIALSGVALAQTPGGSFISLPPVAMAPIPLLSGSGRFSSLDPPNQFVCRNSSVTGQVVSGRLIRVPQFTCENNLWGRHNDMTYDGCCMLMNVRFADPADRGRMAAAKNVVITGTFKSALEMHGSYRVFFLIAEKARILSAEGTSPSPAPLASGMSVMMCQPPQLDALAQKLGRELCVQSSLVADKTTGTALEAAARAPMQGTPEEAASGDPARITCRQDPEHSDAHLPAIACARNNYWAWWVGKARDPVGYGIAAPP